jgi:uncharacterized phage protein gp47/JayE
VAHLNNQPNTRFVTLAAVPGTPSGGTFTVDFEAENAGATVVTPLDLNTIAEPVAGWTAVSNPIEGITGTDTESDDALRKKRLDELQASGSTNIDSIRADLLKVDGVIGATVIENDTDFTLFGITPHSIYCVLRGGVGADIAQSIFDNKAAGIATNGASSSVVLDSQGNGHTIKYDFATQKDFASVGFIQIDPLVFDTVNGFAEIATNISAYVNSLGVGDDVIFDQVKCAVFLTAGVKTITAMAISFLPDPGVQTDLAVSATEFALSDVANILFVEG